MKTIVIRTRTGNGKMDDTERTISPEFKPEHLKRLLMRELKRGKTVTLRPSE